MSTEFQIVVGETEKDLLGRAIEAGGQAIELLKQAENAGQELLQLQAQLETANDDVEHCDPEEERDLGRHAQKVHQSVRHAERVHKQIDDDAVFALDMFMEAFYQLEKVCRDNKPLHNELGAAQSRFQQPHFESMESLDPMEVRLIRLIEFLKELSKPEDVEFRNQLIEKVKTDRQEVRYYGRSNLEVYRVVGELY